MTVSDTCVYIYGFISRGKDVTYARLVRREDGQKRFGKRTYRGRRDGETADGNRFVAINVP